jgi:hypothetical protein
MNVLFVVDSKKSALYTAACARTKILGGSVVAANEFSSAKALLNFLIKMKPATIIFSWRQALLESSFTLQNQYLLKKIHECSVIGILIPDHQGLDSKHWLRELTTLALCDFYMVTNILLLKTYSQLIPEFPPASVLHDLPDREMMEKVRNTFPKFEQKTLRVIWIGNSKWGERQGFRDHKGFQEVIRPLNRLIDACQDHISLEIIDSGVQRIPREIALQRIRQADVLIQASASEGTGLPILEALGLETDVITTDVGVASEIFFQDHKEKLTDRDPKAIFMKLLTHSKQNQLVLRNLYLEYCRLAESERIPEVLPRNVTFSTFSTLKTRLTSSFKWHYRFWVK